MIDMNRLRELTAELGFMPATTEEADIERHRQHNKNADFWLARSHSFITCAGTKGFGGSVGIQKQADDTFLCALRRQTDPKRTYSHPRAQLCA